MMVSVLLLHSLYQQYWFTTCGTWFCLCSLKVLFISKHSVAKINKFLFFSWNHISVILFTDSAHTDFDNEAQTLSLARHPNAKTLVRNLRNKISGTESFKRSRSNTKVKKKSIFIFVSGVYRIFFLTAYERFYCFRCQYVSFKAIKLFIYNLLFHSPFFPICNLQL